MGSFLSRILEGVLVFAFLFSFPACSPSGGKGSCKVVLETDFNQGSRTLAPEGSLRPASFTISGKGPGNDEFSRQAVDGIIEIDLEPGGWTFTARGLDASGEPLVSGSLDANLEAGNPFSGVISVLPLSGVGDFEFIAGFIGTPPDGFKYSGSLYNEATMSETPIAEPAGTVNLSFSRLPSGYYRFSLSLVDSSGSVVWDGFTETVLVYASRVTRGSYSFSLDPVPSGIGIIDDSRMPLGVVIDRPTRVRPENGYARLSASNVPSGSTVRWYANGRELASGNPVLAGPFPRRGVVRINAVASNDGSCGSASAAIEVREPVVSGSSLFSDSVSFAQSACPDLKEPKSVIFSPDSKFAVVAGGSTGALGVYAIDPDSKELYRSCGMVRSPAIPLGGCRGIAFSPDGKYLYACGRDDDAVCWFALSDKGELFYSGSVRNGWFGAASFDAPQSIAVSADGNKAYVVCATSGNLVSFDRDPVSGSLTFRAETAGDASAARLLSRPVHVALDETAGTVVVASAQNDSVFVFREDADGGFATIQVLTDEASGGDGALNEPLCAVMDHGFLRVVSYYGNAVLSYERSPEGLFSYSGRFRNGENGVSGFRNPRSISKGGNLRSVSCRDSNSLFLLSEGPGRGLAVSSLFSRESEPLLPLDGIYDSAVSPDGTLSAAVSFSDGALSLFSLR